MPKIQFVWDSAKATQATARLVAKLGQVDRIALTKLLYYADRDHFLQHGSPITGDVQRAMKHGPVPFSTYAMLSGEKAECEEFIKFLHEDDFVFSLRLDAGTEKLAASEVTILDSIAEKWRGVNKWELVHLAEALPEYKEVYQEGKSELIPYETILKHYETGDGSRFRLGRPVVSRDMMASMPCPLPAW